MKQAAKAAFFIQSRRAGRKAAVGASLYRTVIKEGKKWLESTREARLTRSSETGN